MDRTESILQATSDHPDFQLVGLTLAVDILERSNLLAQQHPSSSHLQTGDDHYKRWGKKLGLRHCCGFGSALILDGAGSVSGIPDPVGPI